MFAALYSVSSPVATLTGVAQSFSPRVEVSGRLVLCDLLGVARLFGGARDIAEHLRRALVDAGAVRVAVAPTHTAAALLALGRPGLSVAATPAEARVALAALPVATLAEWDTAHLGARDGASRPANDIPSGWVHPRDTHQGPRTRREVRGRVQMPRGSRRADEAARVRASQALDVLRRWGIRTLGQYAALPADELSSRLGTLGPRWQHAAVGERHGAARADRGRRAVRGLARPRVAGRGAGAALVRAGPCARAVVRASRARRSRRRRAAHRAAPHHPRASSCARCSCRRRCAMRRRCAR